MTVSQGQAAMKTYRLYQLFSWLTGTHNRMLPVQRFISDLGRDSLTASTVAFRKVPLVNLSSQRASRNAKSGYRTFKMRHCFGKCTPLL